MYEASERGIIIKLMPGAPHETVTWESSTHIRQKISQLPGQSLYSVVGIGATQFNVPGVRSKQGDSGFKPVSRRGENEWPSLMLEVSHL